VSRKSHSLPGMQRRAESFPWAKPHSQSSQGTIALPRPRRAACDSAGLCFRFCFRSCAEPTAEPTAHAVSELTHSLCGGVLIAHRHAFAAVPEALHNLSNCGTLLREPGSTSVSQHVKGDIVESGHLFRFVEEKSKLGSGQ